MKHNNRRPVKKEKERKNEKKKSRILRSEIVAEKKKIGAGGKPST